MKKGVERKERRGRRKEKGKVERGRREEEGVGKKERKGKEGEERKEKRECSPEKDCHELELILKTQCWTHTKY